MTSVASRSAEYTKALVKACANPKPETSAIELRPPSFSMDSGVVLMQYGGGETITVAAETTSVLFLASLKRAVRTGRARVHILERNSLMKVTKVNTIFISSEEIDLETIDPISAHVTFDNVSNSQDASSLGSAAVLNAYPKNFSKMGKTDFSRYASSNDRDTISNIPPGGGGVGAFILYPSLGADLKSTSPYSVSDSSQITETLFCIPSIADAQSVYFPLAGTGFWSPGLSGYTTIYPGGNPNNTSPNFLRPIGPVSVAISPVDTLAIATLVESILFLPEPAAGKSVIWDSALVTPSQNHLSLDSYRASLSLKIVADWEGATTVVDKYYTPRFYLAGFDAAGTMCAHSTIIHPLRLEELDGTGATLLESRKSIFELSGTLSSSTAPIARVAMFWGGLYLTSGLPLGAQDSFSFSNFSYLHATFSISDEMSDAPSKPVIFGVLEGLNASAKVRVDASVLVAGHPSLEKLPSGKRASDDFKEVDFSHVLTSMHVFSRVLPRVYNNAHAADYSAFLTMWENSPAATEEIVAFSFKKFAKGAAKVAKAGLKVANTPIAQELMGMAGLGAVASAARTGQHYAELGEKAHNAVRHRK